MAQIMGTASRILILPIMRVRHGMHADMALAGLADPG
jgi:hypothetical protein